MSYFYDSILIVVCYLLGSIPSGLIIGKTFKNIDIREHGSGNLGATNAFRTLGTKLGITVAIIDVLKGTVAMLIANHWFHDVIHVPTILFGITAVIGHIFPIFANFRGGKAVATSGGVLLISSWPIFVIGLSTFIITLLITRFVSLASTVAAIAIIVTVVIAYTYSDLQFFKFFNRDIYLVITISAFFSFIVVRHIPNYKRLLKGIENKIGRKKN